MWDPGLFLLANKIILSSYELFSVVLSYHFLFNAAALVNELLNIQCQYLFNKWYQFFYNTLPSFTVYKACKTQVLFSNSFFFLRTKRIWDSCSYYWIVVFIAFLVIWWSSPVEMWAWWLDLQILVGWPLYLKFLAVDYCSYVSIIPASDHSHWLLTWRNYNPLYKPNVAGLKRTWQAPIPVQVYLLCPCQYLQYIYLNTHAFFFLSFICFIGYFLSLCYSIGVKYKRTLELIWYYFFLNYSAKKFPF